MAAVAAAASVQVSCSLNTSVVPESKISSRHGLSLAPSRAASVSKLQISNGSRVHMSADEKKGFVSLGGPVALALLAAAVIPDIAEAATPGISPSLKNLLLSVVAGGVVLVAIGGAVAGVSTFDPVQRK